MLVWKISAVGQGVSWMPVKRKALKHLHGVLMEVLLLSRSSGPIKQSLTLGREKYRSTTDQPPTKFRSSSKIDPFNG